MSPGIREEGLREGASLWRAVGVLLHDDVEVRVVGVFRETNRSDVSPGGNGFPQQLPDFRLDGFGLLEGGQRRRVKFPAKN